jgi:hypothetical protein
MPDSSSSQPCRVCGQSAARLFSAQVLYKYEVGYYQCPACEFVQTETPHWLAEAYANPINTADTGLVSRNIAIAKSAAALLLGAFDRRSKFLDYAGGYGMFARLMRDYGYDFYTTDPFTPNLLAKGFDWPDDSPEKPALLTSFECFEHLVEPLTEIDKMLALSPNVFFTTQLIPTPAPPADGWWYYAREHGQHVAFYTQKTLTFIANRRGLHLNSFLNYHLFSARPINPVWYALLIAGGRLGLHALVPLVLGSRTVSDSKRLLHDPTVVQ